MQGAFQRSWGISGTESAMGTTNTSWDTAKLVVKRNFKDLPSVSPDAADEVVRKFATVTHCRLDREHLKSVPILDFLPCLTNLYLQCNEIEEMSNFSVLPGLRFLTLSENKIKKIKGIKNLQKLGFLDLTENRIIKIDFKEIPQSVVILNIADNPCSELASFRDDIIQNLPKLKSLDGQLLEVAEDSSSDESTESSEVKEPTPKPRPQDKKETENDFYGDLSADMKDSFYEFSEAMNEGEKKLENDFTEFTSIPPSSARNKELSDQEITALEREVANITILKPIDSSQKLVPRPPLGFKSNKSRKRPVPGGATTTKVRIPGARPFRRVMK